MPLIRPCLLAAVMTFLAPGGPLSAQQIGLPDGDWSGLRLGAQVGRGDLGAQVFGRDIDLGRIDGLGLHAVYDRDLGRAILGAELAVDRVKVDDLDDSGVLLRLRARLGADLGRVQPYLSAGMARLTADALSETVPVFGAGLDVAVTPRITVGLDYSRMDIDDALEDRLGGRGVPVDADLMQIRAAWRF